MKNNDALRAFANGMIEELKTHQRFDVGDTMRHEDGRIVRVVGGQYWGTYGLSNHWSFKEVLADGSLGPKEHGYGYVLKERIGFVARK